ncbi:MAG: DUF167 domain-containing protein [Verrucomicrobia bacterium]|nr:DUF167 domain-containing protein [Verrucomicrobiota bacterium]NBS05352.1 DUF167 domain-containing protein [Verrucomicrobiota bacterium]NBY37305.1 DUF167 domain-containing protein [Verrucomicrobiota bacterium]
MSEACRLKVKAVPGASRSEIVGKLGEALKIRVAAPPEGGKANREIVDLVAAKLGLSLNQVAVLSGQSSPAKVLSVEGLSAEDAWARLLA